MTLFDNIVTSLSHFVDVFNTLVSQCVVSILWILRQMSVFTLSTPLILKSWYFNQQSLRIIQHIYEKYCFPCFVHSCIDNSHVQYMFSRYPRGFVQSPTLNFLWQSDTPHCWQLVVFYFVCNGYVSSMPLSSILSYYWIMCRVPGIWEHKYAVCQNACTTRHGNTIID